MTSARTSEPTIRFACAMAFTFALLSGCGGAPPPPRAPAAPARVEDDAPRTIAEAEATIARARHDLDAAVSASDPRREREDATTDSSSSVAGGGRAPEAPAESPTSKRPSSPTARPSTARPSARLQGRDEASTPTTLSNCRNACRALASLRRAVEALCRMTGPEDRRCLDAERTLADSEQRIAQCAC